MVIARPRCLKIDAAGAIWALGVYRGVLRQLIKRLKYNGMFSLGELLGKYLVLRLAEQITPEPDVITAVPLHWRRSWRRGYNQAGLIAAGVALSWGKPLLRTLVKTINVPSQVGRARRLRRQLPPATFAARDSAAWCNRKIVLIDDVWTTGTTAMKCRETLLRHGAQKVTIVVAAFAGRKK